MRSTGKWVLMQGFPNKGKCYKFITLNHLLDTYENFTISGNFYRNYDSKVSDWNNSFSENGNAMFFVILPNFVWI